MAERTKMRNHKGTLILIADFFGIQNEKELIDDAGVVTATITQMKRTDIRLLVNVTNTNDSKAAQLKFAECAKQLRPYCQKIAVIGITPVKTGIVNIINKFMNLGIKSFPTEQAACDWLIE